MSKGEETLAFQLKSYNIPFEREFKFHPKRRWRADFCLPEKLLVEVEGAIFTNGRHTRGSGYIKDMEKYNAASKLGYRLLRFTPQQITHGMAIIQIRDFLNMEAGNA